MTYKPPKAIANHPGVEGCNCGEAESSDYRHEVWLKEGWVFENGRNAGGRGLFVNTVSDFKYANPVRVKGE